MNCKMVPSWLTGTWIRSYIRRRTNDLSETVQFGKPDSSISVRYIQTPWAFVDIRSKSLSLSVKEEGKEKPMAFAGITTISLSEDPCLVKWHACIDMDESSMDCQDRWNEADRGTPRPTPDVGNFKDVSKEVNIEHAYHETDPDLTLLEQWVRIDDGDGKFLAIRDDSGEQLLVVAGQYFGYANQRDKVYVSGSIRNCLYHVKENWVIESSASDPSTWNGKILEIPKTLDGNSWKILEGSTLPLDTIKCLI